MVFKNTSVLLLLSFLIGIATNLGLIGAQSYFLSYADAVYTIYGSITASLLFSFLLKHYQGFKLKYSHFVAISISLYTLALIVLAQHWIEGLPKAIIWYLTAFFGFPLLRWIIAELTVRYLDPARAQSYFAYLTAALESGTVIVILLLKTNHLVLNPDQTLWLVISTCLASLAIVVINFGPKKNLEITYSKKEQEDSGAGQGNLQPLIFAFLFMTVAFATISVSEDYLVKTVLKHNLHTYSAIRDMTDSYFSLQCALTVALSLVTGKAIAKMRISPILLFSCYAIIAGVFSLLCLTTQYFYLFILFEVMRSLCESCLYRPGNQMILSAFSASLRARLQSLHGFYYYVVVRTALAFIFSASNRLPFQIQTILILVFIFCMATLALVALFKFRAVFTQTMYQFVSSGLKTTAIIAAHMLSYIRPKDYVTRMNEILALAPKKLLRKTIVLGLGYVKSEDSVEIIKQQFLSEKEEIQIAALDALFISGKLKATQFLLNILLDKVSPKTQRVRLNAMALVAGLYGRKAIPLLLNGLEQADSRVVANSLEVLSNFKDKDLKPIFLQFVNSDVPRVKANALLGLARFPDLKDKYVTIIKECLRGDNIPLVASILYVVGRLKDKDFRAELLSIYSTDNLRKHSALKNVLCWALIRTDEKAGLTLAEEILSLPESAKEHQSFMHFFSLCPQATRYDILKHFLKIHFGDTTTIRRISERLKNSVYDFHEELEYLKVFEEASTQTQV